MLVAKKKDLIEERFDRRNSYKEIIESIEN